MREWFKQRLINHHGVYSEILIEIMMMCHRKGQEDMRERAAQEGDKYAAACGLGYAQRTSKRKTSECIARAIRALPIKESE